MGQMLDNTKWLPPAIFWGGIELQNAPAMLAQR